MVNFQDFRCMTTDVTHLLLNSCLYRLASECFSSFIISQTQTNRIKQISKKHVTIDTMKWHSIEVQLFVFVDERLVTISLTRINRHDYR